MKEERGATRTRQRRPRKEDFLAGTLGVVEAAKFTGLNQSYLRKLITAKRLIITRQGRRILICRNSLIRLLENGRPTKGA